MRDMTIVTTCPFCGKENEIEVNSFDYLAWEAGELIQNAFPYLTAEEREMINTGICDKCWNNTFGTEEPDEDEDFDGEYIYEDDYETNCHCDTYGVCGGYGCSHYAECHA